MVDSPERSPRPRTTLAAALLAALVVLAVLAPGCSDAGDAEPAAPTTSAVLSAGLLPVLVASAEIPAGTEAARAFDEGLLRTDQVTRAQFPADAIVTIELIEGQVAERDLAPGTIVVAGMFVAPEPATTDPGVGSTDG